LDLAKVILSGAEPEMEQFMELAFLPDRDVFALLPGANMIREFYFGNEIHLCAICNGKSGRCTEDCAFCSQSAFSRTKARVYPLLQKEKLREGGIWASETPINRYSIVTSGRSLPSEEVRVVAEALAHLDQDRIKTCASLGILNEIDLDTLKAAGVTRYHHNLETSKSYFDQICTTHTYEQRVDTIAAAKKAGLSVCSGAIFGLGETEEQVLEVALALRDLDVESVPINFLIPLEGTASTDLRALTPLKCLKIISLFRYVLPRKEIIVCGGRERNLKDLHPLIFYAGASGIMTGDYLTTPGRSLERDLEMLETLCLRPRNR
jgi:biotin synthase